MRKKITLLLGAPNLLTAYVKQIAERYGVPYLQKDSMGVDPRATTYKKEIASFLQEGVQPILIGLDNTKGIDASGAPMRCIDASELGVCTHAVLKALCEVLDIEYTPEYQAVDQYADNGMLVLESLDLGDAAINAVIQADAYERKLEIAHHTALNSALLHAVRVTHMSIVRCDYSIRDVLAGYLYQHFRQYGLDGAWRNLLILPLCKHQYILSEWVVYFGSNENLIQLQAHFGGEVAYTPCQKSGRWKGRAYPQEVSDFLVRCDLLL